MGEIAEMMLDGTMCQCCGVWLNDGEDGEGFPQSCPDCADDEDRVETQKNGRSATYQKNRQAVNAGLRAIERSLSDQYGKPIFLSKLTKKRMRKRLTDMISATLQNQGV